MACAAARIAQHHLPRQWPKSRLCTKTETGAPYGVRPHSTEYILKKFDHLGRPSIRFPPVGGVYRPQRRAPRLHWPYVLSFVFILLSMTLDYYGVNEVPIALLFAASIVLSFACENRNLFHLCLTGAHYTFWIYPILVLHANSIYVPIFPLALCVYGMTLALYITQGYRLLQGNHYYNFNINYKYFMLVYVISLFILFSTGGRSFTFNIMILIVSYALFLDGRSLFVKIMAYFFVLSYVVVYSYFYWSGSGRLVIFGVLLGSSLILLKDIRIFALEKWMIFLIMGFGGLLGTYYRFDASSLSEAIAASLGDSNTSPVQLISTIYLVAGNTVKSLSGWLDQFFLFFLAGMPRNLWPGKPFGFGYQYTVENFEQYLQDAGHSVAATFVGEHIYYLGAFYGIFGVTLSVLLIAFLYRFLCRKSILGGYGAIAVAIWLPTYYWGGMQAFSARFSLSAVPLILLYLLHRAYIRTRYDKRRPRGAGA